MFKRRSVIAAFLVVALLAVGVGFAAVSDTLSLGGSVQVTRSGAVEAFDLNVQFEEPIGVLSEQCSVTLSDNNDFATITIDNSPKLKEQGDTASIVLPIVNNSANNATLEIGVDNGVGDGFSIEYKLYSDEGCQTELNPSQIAKDGGRVYLLITFTVTGDPTTLGENQSFKKSIDVDITATSIDN